MFQHSYEVAWSVYSKKWRVTCRYSLDSISNEVICCSLRDLPSFDEALEFMKSHFDDKHAKGASDVGKAV